MRLRVKLIWFVGALLLAVPSFAQECEPLTPGVASALTALDGTDAPAPLPSGVTRSFAVKGEVTFRVIGTNSTLNQRRRNAVRFFEYLLSQGGCGAVVFVEVPASDDTAMLTFRTASSVQIPCPVNQPFSLGKGAVMLMHFANCDGVTLARVEIVTSPKGDAQYLLLHEMGHWLLSLKHMAGILSKAQPANCQYSANQTPEQNAQRLTGCEPVAEAYAAMRWKYWAAPGSVWR